MCYFYMFRSKGTKIIEVKFYFNFLKINFVISKLLIKEKHIFYKFHKNLMKKYLTKKKIKRSKLEHRTCNLKFNYHVFTN